MQMVEYNATFTVTSIFVQEISYAVSTVYGSTKLLNCI